MFCGEDIPLFGDSDMGIDLGGVDGAVSQHFLNEADIYARFQKTGGEGVSKLVEAENEAVLVEVENGT